MGGEVGEVLTQGIPLYIEEGFEYNEQKPIEIDPLKIENNNDLFNTLNDIAAQKSSHRANLDLAGITRCWKLFYKIS